MLTGPQFAIYGVRHSAYSHTFLSQLLAARQVPSCIISIDESMINRANSRSVMLGGVRQYPLARGAWEKSDRPHCLLSLAEQYGIPYLAVADLMCPKLEHYLRQHPQDAILATDGPIVRGSILYAARYGVISVHAAQLPTFRGNWTTYFNLYHNLPLKVSAFVMQPWVDEGVLLGTREVPIRRGMTLEQINAAALQHSVVLAADVLRQISEGTLKPRRQEPWEGVTYRGAMKDGVLQPAMPASVQQELAERMLAGTYGFYDEEPS